MKGGVVRMAMAVSKDGNPILLKHPTNDYEVEDIELKDGIIKMFSYSDGTIVAHINDSNSTTMWCNKVIRECAVQDDKDFTLVEVVK
ncbi:hypothetical protein [Clostridium tetani]|uniref:hypothetical protein n=1 Tax=Clostridium tetani TaxID=1513 RepID=UPI00100A253C|nr:hypothetical protein [Clostridium tetani]